ncbi:MAG: co-chaperone YbbN, partial [Pedococcus sp.]
MTEQPFTAGGLRGAVDLTGLQGAAAPRPTQGPPAGASGGASGGGAPAGSPGAAPNGVPGRSGLVVEGTDANFQEVA